MTSKMIILLQAIILLALLINPIVYLFVYAYHSNWFIAILCVLAALYTISWIKHIKTLNINTSSTRFTYFPNRIWVRFCITLCLLMLCGTLLLWSTGRLVSLAYTCYMFSALLSTQLIYKLYAKLFSIEFKDAYLIVSLDYIKRVHYSEIQHIVYRHNAYFIVYQNTSLYISTSYSKNAEALHTAFQNWITTYGITLKTD